MKKVFSMKREITSLSPMRLAAKKLMRHKLALWSFFILLVFYILAIFAGFFSPYAYDKSVPKKAYHPPVKIRFMDENNKFHFRPFVYETRLKIKDGSKTYKNITDKRYPIKLFVKAFEYKVLGIFPASRHLFGVDEPAKLYVFGADWNGRDIISRIIYGGRVSLSIGLIGVSISISLGMLFGGIAGYFGGWIDHVMMRLVEMIMSVPGFFLMLTLRSVLPLELSSTEVYLMLIVIMSFIGWAGMARVIRGIVLSIRESDYVLAAKALGASHMSIIIKHILPNTSSYVIVAATLSIPSYILGEAALSLLGLGITEPQVSWGNMLTRAMNITDIKFHPWILIAGFAIFIVTMCFNFFGDGLRDALDPKTGT